MNLTHPNNLKYTKEHEWIKVEGDTGIVGITDYAQHKLKNIVFVELPEHGKEVSQGATMAVLESVKSVSDVYSPASGKVTEINKELSERPELLNESPYEKGWIAKIKLKNPAEVKNLMDSKKYEEFIKGLE